MEAPGGPLLYFTQNFSHLNTLPKFDSFSKCSIGYFTLNPFKMSRKFYRVFSPIQSKISSMLLGTSQPMIFWSWLGREGSLLDPPQWVSPQGQWSAWPPWTALESWIWVLCICSLHCLWPGVPLAESLVRKPNQKVSSAILCFFPLALYREGNSTSVGQVVNPASGPSLWVKRGKPSI